MDALKLTFARGLVYAVKLLVSSWAENESLCASSINKKSILIDEIFEYKLNNLSGVSTKINLFFYQVLAYCHEFAQDILFL